MASPAVTIVSNEPAILSEMQWLLLTDIQLDTSFIYKYIKGKIHKMYALCSVGKTKKRKMILEEEKEEGELVEEAGKDALPPRRIIVFLTGAFAEEFIQFSDGDKVIISEALIEKSPSYKTDSIHPYHILVENIQSRPSVWVIPTKKQNSTTANVTNRIRQNRTTAASSSAAQPASSTVTSTITTNQRQNPSSSMSGNSATQGTNNAGGTDQGAGPSTSAVTSSVPSTSSGTMTVSGGDTNREVPGSSVTTSGNPLDAWTVPDGSTSPTKICYTYTLLKDLKEAPKTNIFGVVKFFKPPYKTRGPDYCMTVTLIDPSLDPSQRGLRCQLFRNDINELPQVHTVGDIVRFHRLKVTQYNDNMQGQKGSGFHCLVFDGRVNGSLEARSSSPNYTLTDDDIRRVKELRLWSASRTQLAMENHSCTLAKAYSGQYLDLVCQVVSVATLPSEKCVVIKVWDGTHYRGPMRRMDISAATSIQQDQELANKSDGLNVDVSLYDNHMETGALLKPGQFIKLCNLHAAKFRQTGRPGDAVEMVELVLHHGTSYGRGIIVLMEWEQEVKDIIKRMEDAIQNSPSTSGTANQNLGQAGTDHSTSNTIPADTTRRSTQSVQGTPSRCMQRSASVINDHFHQRTSRIGDVISSDTPNKFRIRAKVVDYLPSDINDFIHLYCAKCKFRCRVPSPRKSTASEKANSSKQTHPAPKQSSPSNNATQSKEYNLRHTVAPKETEGRRDEETNGGAQTRNAIQKRRKVTDSPQTSTGVVTRGRRNREEVGGSPAEESSPGRRASLRKRPVSGSSGNEDISSTMSRKNRRGTSKMAQKTGKGSVAVATEGSSMRRECARSSPVADEKVTAQDGSRSNPITDEKITAQDGSEKRITERDIYGLNITAEMQSSGDDREECADSSRKGKKKITVEIDGVTVEEALLMTRLGMRLVHHADLPTRQGEGISGGSNIPSLGGQVYYVCPRCSPTGGGGGGSKSIPDNAPLLQYKYCMKLILDDGTGSIEVFVDGQHAETFFQGIRATNLHTTLDVKFQLEEAMAKLCPFPIGQGFDTPAEGESPSVRDLPSHPWLECCVLSYPVSLGGKEVIRYQMFDTSLALDVE